MIKHLKGDATCPQGSGDKVIAHVCNNLGRWGRGFVMAVSNRWPQCRAEYLKWYNAPFEIDAERQNNDFALGNVQFIKVEKYIYVANMIGQQGIRTGSKGPPIRYEAVRQCLEKVAVKCQEIGASLHMPRIGSGLAGGNFAKIEETINEVFSKTEIDITVYTLD